MCISHTKLVDNQEQRGTHVEIELLFDVFERLHRYMCVTKEWFEYLVCKQTFAGSWYACKYPCSHRFTSSLIDVCKPVNEVFCFRCTRTKHVVDELVC